MERCLWDCWRTPPPSCSNEVPLEAIIDSSLFLTVFLAYVVLMIVIGWYFSRNHRTGEDFLLGGRDLPIGLMLGTIVATMVGTGSSMGAVGNAYVNGWGGALFGIGGGLGVILLAFFFVDVRKYNFMTMPEELAFYYGANRHVKSIVSVLLYLASIGWLGAHILGGSFYLSWITGLDLFTAKVVTSIGFGLYVIIGGYLAVVWTDSIQAVILFIGFILMAIAAIPAAGGLERIREVVPAENLSFLGIEKSGWIPALSLAVSLSVSTLAVPSFRQRIYSARSVEVARKSFYLSAGTYFAFSILPVIIGLSAYAINPDLENSNLAFPFMATTVLPTMLGSLVLISGLSASMSSGDSDAMTGVTILLRDVSVIFTGRVPPKKKVVPYSRYAIALSILLAFSFTIFATDILGYISKMISTLMSGICVVAFLGRFWKRATWQGAMAALIGGSGISAIVLGVPSLLNFWGNPIVPALIGATALEVVVSLLTPANRVSQSEALAIISSERAAMDI